ncbi:unnamed protein product, partial [Musa acuminata var. zebrina]
TDSRGRVRRELRWFLSRFGDLPMAEIELKTAPADFRFPTTNQTRHCFTRYIEYHKCVAAKGEETPDCHKFAKYYRSLCPGEWLLLCINSMHYCRHDKRSNNCL